MRQGSTGLAEFSWPDGLERAPRPIDHSLQQILRAHRSHQVVIVGACAGAGKTSRLSQAVTLTSDLPTLVTQTRRVQVTMNASWVCHELACEPGGLAGWQLRHRRRRVSDQTRLTFLMDQSLVNRIKYNDCRLPEGTIIVDEAHENTLTLAILLGLLKAELPKNPKTKVIITSATLNAQRMSEYFDDAPVFEVDGAGYPVDTRVLELRDGEHHSEGATRAARSLIEEFADSSLGIPACENSSPEIVRTGAVLMLLPGKGDIRRAKDRLRSIAEEIGVADKLEVYSCHGESTAKDYEAVMSEVPAGILRFVVGTEILRTSVTIPNLIGVIDSLQLKRRYIDKNAVVTWQKIAVSKAEADQAKGRVGREHPGFYIAISLGDEYYRLNPDPEPAIERESLSSLVLQVAATGQSARTFAFLDPPDTEKLDTTISRLQRLGLLDEKEQLTEAGRRVERISLEPELALSLLRARDEEILPEAIVLSAILANGDIFEAPPRRDVKLRVDELLLQDLLEHLAELANGAGSVSDVEQGLPPWVSTASGQLEIDCSHSDFPMRQRAYAVYDFQRARLANGTNSDLVASVQAYREFKEEEASLGEDENLDRAAREDLLRQWARGRFLNYRRLRGAERVMRDVCSELCKKHSRRRDLLQQLPQRRAFDEAVLTRAVLAGYFDSIGVRHGRDYFGPIGRFQISLRSVCEGSPELVLAALIQHVNVGKRSSTRMVQMADLVAPIERDWLNDVAPHLYKTELVNDVRYDSDLDQVVQTGRHRFLNLDLGTSDVRVLDIDVSSRCFANWLVRHGNDLNGQLGEVLRENTELRGHAETLEGLAGDSVLPEVDERCYLETLILRLNGAASISELDDPGLLSLSHEEALRELLGKMARTPDEVRLEFGLSLREEAK